MATLIDLITSYLLTTYFGLLSGFLISFLLIYRFIETKIFGYILLSLAYIIALISFVFNILGFMNSNEFYFRLSVIVMTLYSLPLFFFIRKVFKRRNRILFDIFYLILFSLKIYDLVIFKPILSPVNGYLTLKRARGLLGSFVFVLEILIILTLLSYIIISSLMALGIKKSIKILYLWLLTSILMSSAITILALFKFSITSLYLFIIGMFWTQIGIIFCYSPLLVSFLPLKLKGFAVLDNDGIITFYRVRYVDEEAIFFDAIKRAVQMVSKRKHKNVFKLVVDSAEIAVLPNVTDGMLVLYGWDLDNYIFAYFDHILRKVSSKQKALTENLYDTLF